MVRDFMSTVNLDRLDIIIKRIGILELEIPGAALVSPEFSARNLTKRIGKIRVLFEKLDELDTLSAP